MLRNLFLFSLIFNLQGIAQETDSDKDFLLSLLLSLIELVILNDELRAFLTLSPRLDRDFFMFFKFKDEEKAEEYNAILSYHVVLNFGIHYIKIAWIRS